MSDRHTEQAVASDATSGEAGMGWRVLAWLPAVVIPLGTVITGGITFLIGSYYSQIGIRPADIGVNTTTLLISAIISILNTIGTVGPILLISPSVAGLVGLITTRDNSVGRWLSKPPEPGQAGDRKRIRYLRRLLWFLFFILYLILMGGLSVIYPEIPTIIIAPVIIALFGLSLLHDDLPITLPWRIPELPTKWFAIIITVLVLVNFALPIRTIIVDGPDLRVDGAHGDLDLELLGVDGQPVTVIPIDDPDGDRFQMLRLGVNRNGTIYVLFDPCQQQAYYFSVNAVSLQVIDEVDCSSAPFP